MATTLRTVLAVMASTHLPPAALAQNPNAAALAHLSEVRSSIRHGDPHQKITSAFSALVGSRRGIDLQLVSDVAFFERQRMRGETSAVVAMLDANADGIATRAELEWYVTLQQRSSPAGSVPYDARAAFAWLDSDGDGSVSLRDAYAKADERAQREGRQILLSGLFAMRPAGTVVLVESAYFSLVMGGPTAPPPAGSEQSATQPAAGPRPAPMAAGPQAPSPAAVAPVAGPELKPATATTVDRDVPVPAVRLSERSGSGVLPSVPGGRSGSGVGLPLAAGARYRLDPPSTELSLSQGNGPCRMPHPEDGTTVVAFAAAGARDLSTVAVSSQDHKTHTAVVRVEPGKGKVYALLMTPTAMVWRFEGEVSRIERVVVSEGSHRAAGGFGTAGVVGLPAEKVQYASFTACSRPLASFSDDWGASKRTFYEQAIGVRFSRVADSRSERISVLSLPSLGFEPAGSSPASIIDVDPTAVVSLRPSQPYAVRPSP